MRVSPEIAAARWRLENPSVYDFMTGASRILDVQVVAAAEAAAKADQHREQDGGGKRRKNLKRRDRRINPRSERRKENLNVKDLNVKDLKQ